MLDSQSILFYKLILQEIIVSSVDEIGMSEKVILGNILVTIYKITDVQMKSCFLGTHNLSFRELIAGAGW